MSAVRLTTDEVAGALQIRPAAVLGLAKRRGWQADGSTWSRDDVEAERLARRRSSTPLRADGFTKDGAEKLAGVIRAYWAARGHTVEVWVEPASEYVSQLRTGVWYVVRSDLVDGKPRK